MESVLFANDKGPEKSAEVTCPVPFPVRRPPRVVEPVPPKLVESVVVPMTEPLLLVRRRALVILLMAKLVVVAPSCPILKIVVEELLTASKSDAVPHAVIFEYGVVVPKPEKPLPRKVTLGLNVPSALAPP